MACKSAPAIGAIPHRGARGERLGAPTANAAVAALTSDVPRLRWPSHRELRDSATTTKSSAAMLQSSCA